jgi:hypothetical protein
MEWDEEKVLVNVRRADTDDLMDRITAYRQGMEAAAIDIIEQELFTRGITAAQIAERQEECRRECLFQPDGNAVQCSLCRKPAVVECWDWHKLWSKIPLFRRRFRYCKQHAPKRAGSVSDG